MFASLAQANVVATHTAASIVSFVGGFLIVLILFLAFFLFSRYVGRGQFVALLVSLYAGYALYIVFPFMQYLPTAPAITALAVDLELYAGLCAAAYIVLRRIVVSDFLSVRMIGLAILSFLGAGFLMALAYHVFPVRAVYTFTPMLDLLFAAKAYFFWWFAAPLAGLFFFAH